MGDGGITDSPTTSNQTFGEYAEELCAYYAMLGGPIENFWYGDPSRLNWDSYIKAHEMRNKKRNQEMWLQGLYNYKAFESVISAFSWGLGGKKGEKPKPYMDKPLQLTEKTEEEKQVDAEKARQKIINDLTGWGKNWQKQKKK